MVSTIKDINKIREIDQKAYKLAKAYLPSLNIPEVTTSLSALPDR
jgi:hypothetical protein